MRLIKDHILRNIHGNMVLIPLSDRETDFNGMITLNATGAFLCRMLQKDTDREDLAESLAKEYHVDPQMAGEDVDRFLAQLETCHMLVR